MHIETLLRSWASQFEKDRSAPLAEAAALMLSAANEIVSLRQSLAAERARCAKLADDFAEQAATEGWTGPRIASRTAKAVANAIRSNEI